MKGIQVRILPDTYKEAVEACTNGRNTIGGYIASEMDKAKKVPGLLTENNQLWQKIHVLENKKKR